MDDFNDVVETEDSSGKKRFYRQVIATVEERRPNGSPKLLKIYGEEDTVEFEDSVEMIRVMIPESQFKTP